MQLIVVLNWYFVKDSNEQMTKDLYVGQKDDRKKLKKTLIGDTE